MLSIAFALTILFALCLGFLVAALHEDEQPDQDEFLSCDSSCYCHKSLTVNNGRKGKK